MGSSGELRKGTNAQRLEMARRLLHVVEASYREDEMQRDVILPTASYTCNGISFSVCVKAGDAFPGTRAELVPGAGAYATWRHGSSCASLQGGGGHSASQSNGKQTTMQSKPRSRTKSELGFGSNPKLIPGPNPSSKSNSKLIPGPNPNSIPDARLNPNLKPEPRPYPNSNLELKPKPKPKFKPGLNPSSKPKARASQGQTAVPHCGTGDPVKPPGSSGDQSDADRRKTKRYQALVACIDAAEQRGTCAVVRPGDKNYRAVRLRLRQGEIVSPFPLLYARHAFWESLKPSARALCLLRGAHEAHPEWVFCSFSAAMLYGLSVSYRLLRRVHIHASTKGYPRGSALVQRHCERIDSVTEVAGVPVTTLEQTVLDCLLAAPFCDALALADSALRCYDVQREQLEQFIRCQGKARRAVGRALSVVQLADKRAESGGESIVRALIIEKGYLAPTKLQAEFADPLGSGRSIRVDMLWELPDGRRVAGELDGAVKYTDPDILGDRDTIDVLIDERQRESRLAALGIVVMRFLFKRVYEPGYVENVLDTFGIPRVSDRGSSEGHGC